MIQEHLQAKGETSTHGENGGKCEYCGVDPEVLSFIRFLKDQS
jgi:hypothetical protein